MHCPAPQASICGYPSLLSLSESDMVCHSRSLHVANNRNVWSRQRGEIIYSIKPLEHSDKQTGLIFMCETSTWQGDTAGGIRMRYCCSLVLPAVPLLSKLSIMGSTMEFTMGFKPPFLKYWIWTTLRPENHGKNIWFLSQGSVGLNFSVGCISATSTTKRHSLRGKAYENTEIQLVKGLIELQLWESTTFKKKKSRPSKFRVLRCLHNSMFRVWK